MRAHVVKIGNSRGIRIPKPLLDQTGIVNYVELEVEKDRIIIRPVMNPRIGWEKSFKAMAANRDDEMGVEDGHLSHSWDEEEWQW
jgi:antitoxin MazE